MSDDKYKRTEWETDKILVARLLQRGEYNNARKHLEVIHLIEKPNDVEHQLNGMLFIMDILGIK